jgi:Cu(I)/Ag(I) efflux system membrane protein CusA/SilA
LKVVLPVTLMIIFVLLFITFKRISDALLIMGTLPFSLIGGVWLLWLLEYGPWRAPSALLRWREWRQSSA